MNDRLSDSAQLYVGIVVSAGVVAVAHSVNALLSAPVSFHWFLLAGLTLLSGSFTVRIPTIPARLSVSETFVFAAVLLFGPAAATVIVVLDTLVISLWLGQRSRRLSRVLFNIAAPAVSIWIASHVFYWLAGVDPLSRAPRPILSLLMPLLALAILYFLLNSFLIALAVGFEKSISAFVVWRQNFLWLSLNYFSGASVAALLLPYLQEDQGQFVRVIGVLLPLLLISYLTFKTALGRVDDANRHLSELNRLHLSTIETLAMAIDAKDQITHGHIRRVQTQAVRLAEAMGVTDSAQIKAIEAAALLHDMGKLAVPEYILNKPGPLTTAEFEKMKQHASIGADILSSIDFPYPVVPIVRHHHESWDGSGYPTGLQGSDIPIGARILSVVDCFDALTSDRPYRPRLPDKDALKILIERRGRMYDPLVVDTFLKLHADTAAEPAFTASASSLDAIAEASFPARPFVQAPNRLEDITASGEETLALFDLARGLAGAMSLSDTGDVLLKHLRRLVPASLSAIYVYDIDGDELVASYTSGENAGLIHGLRISLGHRLTGWVGANRQTIRNSDPVLDFGELARAMTPRPRSCLSAPLIVHEELVGVLSLYSTHAGAFTENHQHVLEVVAKQVAPVVRESLTFDRTTQSTYKEQLLALPGIEQLHLFASARAAAQPDESTTSFIYISVFGFGAITSAHGRETGDRVLNYIASCIRRHIRPADVIFRYRNDEFVVALLRTDTVLATSLGDRIRNSAAAIAPHWVGVESVRLSVGVSQMPQDGDSVEALVRAARERIGVTGAQSETHGHPPESIH